MLKTIISSFIAIIRLAGRSTLMAVLGLPFLLTAARCQSVSEREKSILDYSGSQENRYEEYLIAPGSYTTNGALYHDRYSKCLVGIAIILTEEQKLVVQKRSVGFYHDRKDTKKKSLYLGLDIDIPVDAAIRAMPYPRASATILGNCLRDVLMVMNGCTSAYLEKDVVGVVVGFHWASDQGARSLNIWIDEKDVAKYENSQLTMQELISRSFVTNSEGKVIRLLP